MSAEAAAMCVRFEQHIFAGDPYGTVAMSDGIARGDVELIERHAASYDLPRGANEYRAFALMARRDPALMPGLEPGGGRQFVVMTARVVPGIRGNNYLAHSYIVPGDALEAISANWAWLTLRLPALGEYQPLRTRLDRLSAIERSLDPVGQFRYFRFLVAEQTSIRVEALLCTLLRHLEQPRDKPLGVEFAPPHPELAALLQDTFAVRPSSPPPAPNADDLALLRTVGLLAPLPLVFQLQASYAINAAATGGDCAFTVVPNAERSAPVPWGHRLRYVQYCVGLAQKADGDALQRLRDLQRWMSHLVGTASIETLEAAFALYADVHLVLEADPGAAVPAAALADRLAPLARSGNIRISDLRDLLSRVGFDDYSLADRLWIWRALTPLLASGDLDDRVLVDVRQVMSAPDPELQRPAIELFRSLAPDAQVRLWTAAARDNVPPARSAPIWLQLACVTVDTLRAADRAEAAILDDLIASLPASGLTWPRLTRDLEPLVARLQALAHTNAVASPGVLPALVERIVQCFVTSTVGPRQIRLSDALGLLLESPQLFERGRSRHAPEVMAHAIASCWRWSPADIDPGLVLGIPPLNQRGDMRLMLDMLATFVAPHYPLLRELLEVQAELLGATLDACSEVGYRTALLNVPRYAAAIDTWRPPQGRGMPVRSRARLEGVHESLRAEVSEKSVPATAAVLLGTSYLNHYGGNPTLFSATASRAAEMIRTSPCVFASSLRARMLAELFAASEPCKQPDLLEDITSFLIADDTEAEKLCAWIAAILRDHKRDPPAWKAVQKQRSSWRSRLMPWGKS